MVFSSYSWTSKINLLEYLLEKINNIPNREFLEEYLIFPNTILHQMKANNKSKDYENYRLTIDYKEDCVFINKLLKKNIKFDSKIKKIINEIKKSNSLKSMTEKLQKISKSHFDNRKSINTFIN